MLQGALHERARVDVLLALALLPYVLFLTRRRITIGDAIEVALIFLAEARFFLSISGFLPMSRFENSFAGALTVVVAFAVINVAALSVPTLRQPL